jgi:arylsulfatase A-like enzyme
MKSLILILALLAQVVVRAAQPPNIIFILSDDQGYGDLQAHGHPLLKTPHLDSLQSRSVRFENFHVSPSCSPTRAALMTGMHEFANGVTHTQEPREHLRREATILPQLLKMAGYRTGFIGKWHLGNDRGYAARDRGFDWWSNNVGGAGAHFDPAIIRNGRRQPGQGFREDLLFDEAMAFIDAEGQAGAKAPFFCYLATYSPHAPLAAPEAFIAPFRNQANDEQAAFFGMIANIDYNVGRLLNHLRQRDLEKNTIVVYMNDNGGTYGVDVFNAGLRGCKCTLWPGGTRAISFWSWPGTWKPHSVANLTAHLDVLPTLCDLAGVRAPEAVVQKWQGFSLRPLLESEEPIQWHEDRLLFQHVGRWPSGMAGSHRYSMAAVRSRDYLLIRSEPCNADGCLPFLSQCATLRLVAKGALSATYTAKNAQLHWGTTPPGQWALFHTGNDPLCRDDLRAALPDLAKNMSGAFDRWWDAIHPAMLEAGGDSGTPVKLGQRASPQAD